MDKLKYLFLIINLNLIAQNNGFLWPLNEPISLVGNYGELRPNHFHAGLDFSTQKKTGLPVLAAAAGYVSRIRVSALGYGKAIYITHPNGKVTLYGHLTSYIPEIASYVKAAQYKNESFEIELLPGKNEIEVKAGQIIGYSGNTGNSSGPHLHFEIRDEITEVPLNPLSYYKIQDNQKPVVTHIGIYNLEDTTSPKFIKALPVNAKTGKLKKDTIELSKNLLGIAFSGYDCFTAGGSKNAIYKIMVSMDGKLVFHQQLDGIPFSDQRYVNQVSEVVEKVKYQKCFMSQLYPDGMFKSAFRKGRIIIKDSDYHLIDVAFADENNNTTKISFYVKANKLGYYKPPFINGDTYLDCLQDFIFDKKGLQIFIPKRTLFNSTPIIFENTLKTTGKLIILPSDASLNSTAIVGFEIPPRFMKNKDKLVFSNNQQIYLPILHGDSVFYSVKNFGWFQLFIDTMKPTIFTEASVAAMQQNKSLKQINFIVKEELSGVKDYRLTCNGKWVLMEYDPKSNRMIYYFDADTPKGKLDFKLEVTDRCNNKNELSFTITRK